VSGSFPALNICTFAACETLKLKYVSIASASASQWGANVPDLLWIDMERVLNEEGIFTTRSVASSIGGEEDRGLGLSDEGRKAVLAGIARNGLELIDPPTFEENVAKRLDLYRRGAQGQPVKCYINVGGGAVSVGRAVGKKMFKPGLNVLPPLRVGEIDGVMHDYITQGVPVIHLVQIVDIAERYGLPVEPLSFPEVGEANVFEGVDYNKPLVAAVLAVIVGCLYGFIRSDIGFRLLNASKSKAKDGRPEPMV
jgi:poly-gamma-glutamate system protein